MHLPATLKSTLMSTLLLSLNSIAAAAPQAPSWLGAADCRIFHPNPQPGQSASWSGPCVDGYASGSGVLQWTLNGQADGLYQGTMERGAPKGKGTRIFNDGSTLSGDFAGSGGYNSAMVERVYLNGDRYTGSWFGGAPSGQGTMALALGGSYEGQWKNGKFDGAGVITYPNGKRLEGRFKDGVREGEAAIAAVRGSYKVTGMEPGRLPGSRVELVRNAAVPPEKNYAELTPEQQHELKRSYLILQDEDEPPYPLEGPKKMYKYISDAQRKVPINANLFLVVMVDKDGKGTDVRILQSPSPELSRYVAAVLTEQKYKPAKCAGEPCAMAFPVRMRLSTH